MRRRAKVSIFPNAMSRGFTLMEVTITLAILGFIVLIIFGAFRMGVSAWEKGDSLKEEYEKVRIASQLISRQIKSIVPYRVKTQKAEGDYVAFDGKSQTLRFVSALSTKGRQPEGFTYAIYTFKSDSGDEGRLILYEKRALNKDLFEESPKEDEAVSLCEGISKVKFEYYREEDVEKNQKGGWLSEWNAKEEKELPRAVRVTLNYKNDKKEDAPITLVVSVPAWKPDTIAQAPMMRGRVNRNFSNQDIK